MSLIRHGLAGRELFGASLGFWRRPAWIARCPPEYAHGSLCRPPGAWGIPGPAAQKPRACPGNYMTLWPKRASIQFLPPLGVILPKVSARAPSEFSIFFPGKVCILPNSRHSIAFPRFQSCSFKIKFWSIDGYKFPLPNRFATC